MRILKGWWHGSSSKAPALQVQSSNPNPAKINKKILKNVHIHRPRYLFLITREKNNLDMQNIPNYTKINSIIYKLKSWELKSRVQKQQTV
jgi:hypothetical protein